MNNVVNNEILILMISAIVVGIVIGAIIVLLIFLRRGGNQTVNSFPRPDPLLGAIGIVSLPFDADSTGKIRLTTRNSMRVMAATSNENHCFAIGDRVVVVEVLAHQVCVISEQSCRSF